MLIKIKFKDFFNVFVFETQAFAHTSDIIETKKMMELFFFIRNHAASSKIKTKISSK